MKRVAKLAPGQPGTAGLVEHYGEVLVRVRIYHDELRLKRVKTVELVLEETDLIEPTRRVPVTRQSGDHGAWELEPPMILSEEGYREARASQAVFLRIEEPDPVVLTGLHAAGASYHEPSRSWVLCRKQAELLGLLVPQISEWIVETLPEPLPVGLVGRRPEQEAS